MPRKCIAAVALNGSLPGKLEAASWVGFCGVEIKRAAPRRSARTCGWR